MTWVEIVATLFGIVSVILTVRENILCWPVGLVWAALSLYVYFDYKLYSDMLLAGIYIPLILYGWYYWVVEGEKRKNEKLEVSRITKVGAAAAAGVFFVGFVGLGTIMGTFTDADVPYLDAITTVGSLVAQYLMARKLLENWVVWILVDALAIGIYIYKELYVFSGLYGVFIILAISGLVTWVKSWRADRQNATEAST